MNLDFNAIAVKAVYESMTDEQRAEMVRTVVDKMLREKDNHFGSGKSVIEKEIERQVRSAVSQAVEEYMTEHDAAIRTLVGEIIGKVIHGDERSHLVNLIAETINRGLRLAD